MSGACHRRKGDRVERSVVRAGEGGSGPAKDRPPFQIHADAKRWSRTSVIWSEPFPPINIAVAAAPNGSLMPSSPIATVRTMRNPAVNHLCGLRPQHNRPWPAVLFTAVRAMARRREPAVRSSPGAPRGTASGLDRHRRLARCCGWVAAVC